jgi:AraC-like DNA-binding protein
MYYIEFPPHALLRPYIKSYYHLRVIRKVFQQPADGCANLMISLGDPFELGFEGGKLEVVSGCRVLGPFTRRLFTRHMGQTNLVTVKFMPGGLRRFFRVPAIELTDTSAGLESLWGKSGRELEERLVNASNIPEITKHLDDVFLSRLSSQPAAGDTMIPAVLGLMSSLKGRIQVEDIARRVALSRRRLERRFADSVGLCPKRMCRITRFLSAFSRRAPYEGLDWAELAYTNDYSDQAHLIRECKFFTGHSPTSYLKNRSSLEPSVMCTVNTIPD